MRPNGEELLLNLIDGNAGLRLVESHLYSVFRDGEVSNAYDSPFGNIYDRVACNLLYNRLVWGYSIKRLSSLACDALRSSTNGNVLDLGCGSLAFTAKAYIQYQDRPVVLLDQSLKMLQIARSRLINLNGRIPENIVLLHADALRLPFRDAGFRTIIAQNLLHCLEDTKTLFAGLKRVATDDCRMYFTTLIRGNRPADKYLQALADGGKLVPRSIGDHLETFRALGMSVRYDITGNMAFIYCDL